MKHRSILIVGAGFSGAVVARELAEAGFSCQVIDRRPHLAGNCHTARAEDCAIMEHRYGPHIFHTSDTNTWKYVKRFAEFMPHTHRVKASTSRGFFNLPINLQTINEFFGTKHNSDEARLFLQQISDTSIDKPRNFEEQALRTIGQELYETFFYGYTRKQWGCEPKELPAGIFNRLPLRFNYDDHYYHDTHCGIPRDGYTSMVARMLDHPLIRIQLSQSYETSMRESYTHTFYSGPIDGFYDYCYGGLGYRSVRWERQVVKGSYQENPQVNYPELTQPFTRIHEHKHFSPWEKHELSSVFTEYSLETGPDDEPAYPKRLSRDIKLLQSYETLARQEENLSFIGRLGTYRYLDMHVAISEARLAAKSFLSGFSNPQTNYAHERPA